MEHIPADKGKTTMHLFSIYLVEKLSTTRNLFVLNFRSTRPLSVTGDQQQDTPCQVPTGLRLEPLLAHHFWLILMGS